MLSNSLSTSAKIAALYRACPKLAEFCRALFPLLVAHADDHGRLAGDEQTVKLKVDPITPRRLDDFVAALHVMHEVGLITWYQVDDRKVIEIVKFGEHQDLKGHDKRPPKLPACPGPDALIGRNRRDAETSIKPGLGESSPRPPQISLKEEKGSEEKRNELTGGSDKAPSEARAFLVWFQQEYGLRRNGAVYFVSWAKHTAMIKRLLAVFPLERLKRLATVLLTTNEDWMSSTDRGIEVFVARINWLEERVRAWEVEKKAREAV